MEQIQVLKPRYSYSKITAYQQCPYKYKLLYIDRIKTKKSKYLSFGLTVSDIVEEIYKNPDKYKSIETLDIPRICSAFWIPNQLKDDYALSSDSSYAFLGYSSEQEETDWYSKLVILIQTYINRYPIQPVFAVEDKFILDLGELEISGRIDWIEFDNEVRGINIVDNKSGKNMVTNLKDDIQLNLYKLAVLNKYPSVRLAKVGLYYLLYDKKIMVDNKILETQKVIDIIYKEHNNIINGTFPKIVTKLCPYCEVKHACK